MIEDKRQFWGRVSPWILVVGLSAIYFATLAPDLTWANDGADGGDLITAAATGGIAHPTGYPVYLIIARLFQLLPFGSLAYRTNLFSAAATTAAAVLVFTLVKRQLDFQRTSNVWLSSLIAGFAFGLSPLVWSQAVITEVYAFNAFFVALVLYVSTSPYTETRPNRVDRIVGLLLGLGTGVHVTIIFLSPIVLLMRLFRQGGGIKSFWKVGPADWRSALRTFVWIVAGWTPHLLLPIWASSHPPVNWGDPVTWRREWWLVTGQLYRGNLFGLSSVDYWSRLHQWAGLLIEQFGLPGLCVALLGLTVFFSPSRLFIASIWNALIFSLFAINYNTADWYVYLIPASLSFAIWVGFGVSGLMNVVRRTSRRLGWALGAGTLLSLFIFAGIRWPHVDASRDLRADYFGEQIMAQAPANALVFVQGDSAIFSLWYFHYALHERPDIVVVAADLLSFDWYQDVIRSTYPRLILPGQFPWPIVLEVTNPERPACFVQYTGRTEMQCLIKSAAPGERAGTLVLLASRSR